MLTRPTWAEIDLQALQNNARTIIKHAGAERLIAVVKANAYGHGAVDVAHGLRDIGVADFGVATVDEGLELRAAGIDGQIALLGVQDVAAVPVMVAQRLTPAVGELAWLQAAVEQIADGDVLTVQIEADTGMGRMGARDTQTLQAVYDFVMAEPKLAVAGVFMHFATADDTQVDYFAQQYALFEKMIGQTHIPRDLVHVANSGTALWHANEVDTHTIRVGSALYGYNPSVDELPLPVGLQPVLRLVSQLGAVHQLKKGESVSYGATFTAERDMWVGTLPIGYADGYRRSLQGAPVLVNGVRQQVIGRVTMDQILVTLDRQYPVGTNVTLIGTDGADAISLEELAAFSGTIPHELLTQISLRVPRVIV